MWKSFVVLAIGCFVVLRARSVFDEDQSVASGRRLWRSGYEYSTIPLNERFDRDRFDREERRDCKCTSKPRYTRVPRIRTVIRRNDVQVDDSDEAMESLLEEYLLKVFIKKGMLTPSTTYTPIKPTKSVFRTQKQIQQQLPAFKHERAEYSDEENFRMSHNSRFYSQEPVPGQLLYPPISPKFTQTARIYTNIQGSNNSKPRYVSSMLIPHFLNNTIAKPNENVRNILRMNATDTEGSSTVVPRRVRYGKNAGYINLPNDSTTESNFSNTQV